MSTLHRRKQNSGFTIAELLIVVAIIGVLVAVSIPVFAGQLRKAKVATNKANIRAARAAGIAQLYDDETAGKFTSSTAHAYYRYDIKSGTITQSDIHNDGKYPNSGGDTAYNTALKYEVCSYIVVYVAPYDGEKGATIQTAPYYTETSGDKPDCTINPNNKKYNYFGPTPGNS